MGETPPRPPPLLAKNSEISLSEKTGASELLEGGGGGLRISEFFWKKKKRDRHVQQVDDEDEGAKDVDVDLIISSKTKIKEFYQFKFF